MLRESEYQLTPRWETCFFVLVRVLSTCGTRTRPPCFEYEYHFIEYEHDYD